MNSASKILAQCNLSETKPRKAILNILIDSGAPLSLDEIGKLLPTATCNQSTIYRFIKILLEFRVVEEVDLNEGFLRYEIKRSDHHHHHIICLLCKKISCIHDCPLSSYFKQQLSKTGYKAIKHHLEFSGICPNCSEA